MRPEEKILALTGDKDIAEGLKRAAEVVLSGGAVVFPTESFYGLGVNVEDEGAINRLFEIKGRREDQPILILISSREEAGRYASYPSGLVPRLMDLFWPGGLTMVLHAKDGVSSLLTAGTGKIGLRLSSHPIATGLARAAAVAITGTSANVSGSPPCARVEEVVMSIGKEVDLILDGGPTAGGRGSTVLDLTVDPPRILREGMVGREALSEWIAPI